ncbi:hypothetical protein B0H16DRAFT_1458919 [Mycena metata]|uniref:Uncharacterized protein n=1 Tax=Mycena metata TaxID=1033252 RepID=A0AAD7NCC9_9AGAR|nr:hypothetical protein B0H16DRAFT_1458919 [Mycena metata]
MASVAGFKIPSPWDRNSPHFDGKSASSLKKFLRHCKTIVEDGGVKVDDQKSKFLEYLDDDDIRDQWESFESFKPASSLENWIDEIKSTFPELQDDEVGSLSKLTRLIREHKGMERSEYGKIKRFNTAYLVEAKKLRQEPTVLPDNALVEMYLETLESGFAQEVRVNMTQMKLLATRLPGLTTPTPAPTVPKVKRRGEIPLEDVLNTAETIAEHFGGTGLQVNLSTGPVQPVSVLPPVADKTTVKREVAAHLEERSASRKLLRRWKPT